MTTKNRSILTGKRVRLHVLGCRSNLYEAEALATSLSQMGAVACEKGPFAAAVLVSCVVTAEAERKCRQLVRRLKRQEPEAPVVVCGCWAQFLEESVASDIGIDALVGNRRKHRVPAILEQLIKEKTRKDLLVDKVDVSTSTLWDPLSLDCPKFHQRAFIKIQEGCNHRCTYCIIPEVRGAPVSRAPEDALEEVGHVVSRGIREVVLTGIHLALYGKDTGESLAMLVRAIEKIRGLDRLRFGSIEPFGLEEEVLEALAASEKFCPHLHLPLQSGDDRILRRMGRGCSSQEFLDLVKKIKKFLGDDLHLSTDVIVGFPGEDDAAFRRTFEVLERAGVGKIHAFGFSPRKGTPAAEFRDRPSPEEVKDRMSEMLDFASRKHQEYASRWIGKRLSVLVEKSEKDVITGYTPPFIKAVCKGRVRAGDITEVEITGCSAGVLEGRVCYNAFSGTVRQNEGEGENQGSHGTTGFR
ncbi:MAG: tRNA (N(6)-L-threonylcarbamoyladenosine(37)-C(2))-methylthiotransferase MtaB [Thermovirgaceae bacterium]